VRFSELEGARVGVWGAGREIVSFASQLRRRLPNAEITVAAFETLPDPDVLELLGAPRARLASGAELPEALLSCEVVVRSPGVSTHRPEIRALGQAGVAVTTATALWLAERAGTGVVGVTGTKGKSTTAALLHRLLAASGRRSRLAGNIGVPALDLLDADPSETAVVELSSYQIADLAVGPQLALVTNVFREHLDWHGSEQAYRDDKLRLLGLPGVRGCVLSARDPVLAALAPQIPTLRFGSADGWDATAAGISRAGKPVAAAAALPLPGEHNALNLCAALTALEALEVPVPSLPSALSGFQPLPHRLQTVLRRAGLVWVDDSISTTPESTLAALASFPGRPVVLIAGGQDRGQDFLALGSALAERGAAVLGVPTTGSRVVAAARRAGVADARARLARDLPQAVALAPALLGREGVVLLSPAAPSYDHYRNFEERGERFRALAEDARAS